MMMRVVVLLCSVILVVKATPSLRCGASSSRAFCNVEDLDLNEAIPESFDDKIEELFQIPSSVADLLPDEWDDGLLQLAGIDRRYCHEFCFPEAQECTTILGERVCTPRVCASPCVNVPAYDTLNQAPNSLIEGAIDEINDGLSELVTKALEGLRLLPAFTVSMYVTTTCDPELGIALLLGSDTLVDVSIPASELLESDAAAAAGDTIQYDRSTRTLTLFVNVPLSLGLVEGKATLEGVVVGDEGASVNSITVHVHIPTEDRDILMYQKSTPTTIGTVSPCYSHDSCSTCVAATDGCHWCATNSLCAPVTSSCTCAGECGGFKDSVTGCPAPREVCWVGAPAVAATDDDSAVVITVAEYEDQLGRLEVLSPTETRTISLAIDSNADGSITDAELVAYQADPAAHPTLERNASDDVKFDGVGVVAVVAGVLSLLGTAITVAVGVKRPSRLRISNIRKMCSRGGSSRRSRGGGWRTQS